MRRLSLKVIFTLIYVALLATLLLSLFLLNRFFLQSFYESRKLGLVDTAYETIDEVVKYAQENDITIFDLIQQESTQDSDTNYTQEIFRELNERSNIDVALMKADRSRYAATSRDSEWLVIKLNTYINLLSNSAFFPDLGDGQDDSDSGANGSDITDINDIFNNENAISDRLLGMMDINEQYESIDYSDNYVTQRVVDTRSNSSRIECVGLFSDNDTYFLMSIPLESIEEGVAITMRFLLHTGILVLILGSIAVYFVISYVTRPINQLAKLSERIANLDFSSRYEGKSLNEIGLLGNSMNTMADRLEGSINKLSEANEALQRDIQEKEKNDEARRDFIANVSHELKTPISLIGGYAEGLVEGLAETKENRDYYCGVIMDEAVKMNEMVKQLTSLMSYEFNMNDLDKTDFNICDLIRSVLDVMKLKIEEKNAGLIVRLPESIIVKADEFKIEEVFTNYFNNAMNHLDGGRRIIIRSEENEKSVTIFVYNDGNPIPKESLEHVWDKFYKVDKAHSRQYGGSGIGLSIVKAIMDSHGGSYAVNNVGSGVEFSFTLKK